MTTEILIVDDNVDIRNILNELIVDAGYKTRVAANYNQALKEIDKKINISISSLVNSNNKFENIISNYLSSLGFNEIIRRLFPHIFHFTWDSRESKNSKSFYWFPYHSWGSAPRVLNYLSIFWEETLFP